MGQRILVVDDESRMVRFVRMKLELEGYQGQLLDLVLKESGRVNTIINDFLAYSRMRPASLERFRGADRQRAVDPLQRALGHRRHDDGARRRGARRGGRPPAPHPEAAPGRDRRRPGRAGLDRRLSDGPVPARPPRRATVHRGPIRAGREWSKSSAVSARRSVRSP